jgi:pyruvate/2-oxoglutarate dehydrogenase complex dihydrolipoamide dehydrogenase (E3) component
VKLNTTVRKITTAGADKILHLGTGGQPEALAVDKILVGVGRAPNVEGLGLDAVGVQYSKQGVVVNEYLQTTNPRIYAAGDICLPYKFTHTADASARMVIQNALFKGRKKLSALTVPWCTYTDPEIAHVGLYEREAREHGFSLDTFKILFGDVDRAILEGEENGFVKIHVKKGTDQIVGGTIVAAHAGEMISEISLAIAGKIGLGTLANVIHPYPTQAEAIRKAGDAYNRTRLTPFVKNLFTRWLAWSR